MSRSRKPTTPARAPKPPMARVIPFPSPPGTAKRLARAAKDVKPPGAPLPPPRETLRLLQPSRTWFIGEDGDSHRYLVPTDCRDDFEAWVSYPSDDERGWERPSYAYGFEGEELTFTDPRLDGESVEDLMTERPDNGGGAA